MSKRSMAKTAPGKMRIIDEKNPENKDTQTIEENDNGWHNGRKDRKK